MSDSVYDGKVYLRLSVDVSQPNMFAPPLVKQGDSNTRALVITLTDNSEPIAIPDDATVWLNCRNTADNEKRASVECEINADGTVTGIVPTVVMEAAGIIECDVSVITLSESNETELLKSTLFCLSCERAANKDGTTTEAEDSILTGIASGEITIPAAKGDPGPPGPPGPAGSSVTIINAETVPESANWDGEIPTTYAGQTGEEGEIALWGDELWYLYNVATRGQITYYHWDKVAVTEDLEAKMDLAPLNPTAEQIAAMPSGQLYSDTTNHKGVIKGRQEFYDTTYVDENYRKTVVSNKYPQSINGFNAGDKWICCARSASRDRTFVFYKPQKYDGIWAPLNNYLETSFNPPPNNEVFDSNYVYQRFVGDEYIHASNGTQDFYKLAMVRNTTYPTTYGTRETRCDYTWVKIYSSSKIDQKGFLTLETLPIYDGTVI